MKKSHQNNVTKHQNVKVEKKTECPMEGNCQVNDVVYKQDVRKPLSKKMYLGFAEGE